MGTEPEIIELLPIKPKIRRPRATRAVKDAILVKASSGQSKTQIAADLKMGRNTVTAILNASEIGQHIEEIRSDIVQSRDLWKARKVLADKLDKGSESAATTMLRGFNVLRSGDTTTINIQNNGAISWVNVIRQEEENTQPNS